MAQMAACFPACSADMLFATAGQSALFLWMMTSGIVIGLWYVLLRALRRLIQAGFLLTLLCDLCFGAGSAAIWTAFLVSGNYGHVRLFEVFSALLGALIFAMAALPLLGYLEIALCKLRRNIWAVVFKNRLIKVIFK